MPPDAAVDEPEPEVILDIVFEDGLLFAAVRNISARPAYRVSVGFDKDFTGLGGAQNTSALHLFRNIEFLAPQKEIRTLVDAAASYFARKQPKKLVAEVRWRSADGKRHSHTITHDLSIYEQVAYVTRKETHAGLPT
jgi:hypothetical protein